MALKLHSITLTLKTPPSKISLSRTKNEEFLRYKNCPLLHQGNFKISLNFPPFNTHAAGIIFYQLIMVIDITSTFANFVESVVGIQQYIVIEYVAIFSATIQYDWSGILIYCILQYIVTSTCACLMCRQNWKISVMGINSSITYAAIALHGTCHVCITFIFKNVIV